ncbi:MAG: phosphate ABC transporter substrate-binding protein PstS [Gaiellaceae bacterium]
MRRVFLSGIVAIAAALAASAIAAASVSRQSASTLNGAGSTLVAPLIQTWVTPLESATSIRVTYNGIGSGGGIAAITNRQVDFGASDAPLTPDQFSACKGCIQIPWALSAVSLTYNVKGVPGLLHLNANVIAKIFLGAVTKWSDPSIKKLNPKLTLPDETITPVFRSDGSGTTYAFTDYLSKTSAKWASTVGKGTSVHFPAGVGAKGNSGVAGVITTTEGAIGYTGVDYTVKNHLKVAEVQNAAGFFATPGIRGMQAAASLLKSVPADNNVSITSPPKGKLADKKIAKIAYPISTFTYVIVPQKSSKTAELKQFISWALTKGQSTSITAPLIFAPMPKLVIDAATKALSGLQAG